jgi:hypothetical protein
MNGALAFLFGFGFKNIKPALYGWFFNILFSLVFYAGICFVFSAAAGTSIIAADVTGQIGIYSFFSDISRNYSGGLSLLVYILPIFVILYYGFSIYAAGGIFSVLIEDEKTTFTNLVTSSSGNFPDMFKVFLFYIPVLVVILSIPILAAILFLKYGLTAVSEEWHVFLVYFWIGLTVLLFIFSTIIYDFARIYKLKEDRSLFQTYKKAAGFLFSNKMNILVVFLIYGLSLLILYLGYKILMNFFGHLLHVVLLFIFYQVWIAARYYLKIVLIRAELRLMEPAEV